MKPILKFIAPIVLFCFSSYNTLSQSKLEIRFNEKTETVAVGDLTIDAGTTLSRVIEAMGEPSKKVDYPSGEVSLFYEEKGIVFFTQQQKVLGMGINFNSDGDKKFPATSLNGKLLIGNAEITKDSKQADILNIKEFAFTCPFTLMCASSKRDAKTAISVAFKNGLLTQVAFLLNAQ